MAVFWGLAENRSQPLRFVRISAQFSLVDTREI
jgi:hypothetical protein